MSFFLFRRKTVPEIPNPAVKESVPQTPTPFTNDDSMRAFVGNNILYFYEHLQEIVDNKIKSLSTKCQSNTFIALSDYGVPTGSSIVNNMIKEKVDKINACACKYVKLSFDETKGSSIILTIDLNQVVTDIDWTSK